MYLPLALFIFLKPFFDSIDARIPGFCGQICGDPLPENFPYTLSFQNNVRLAQALLSSQYVMDKIHDKQLYTRYLVAPDRARGNNTDRSRLSPW